MVRALIAAVATLLAGIATGTARAATFVDPALRFRMLPTEHFIIYFHQGEEPLARRLAVIAEETWRTLQQPLRVTPPRRTHIVLVDQTELANGFATPLPYDTVMITAVWPIGSEFIGNTDDWLRLVFTHEYTHVLHLDRSEGWARIVRRLFGRMEIAFPNLFLPAWQIEGIATFEESRITGEGRLHAGDFGAVLKEAARHRALEPLDRVNGGLTDWPDGDAVYAYGLGFHQYLADRFGADKLGELADATARRVPYTGSRVFRRVFGASLGELWREYERSIAAPQPSDGSDAAPTRLTRHNYIVRGPRFDPVGCDGCPASVVYAVRSPDGFPALNRVTLDDSAPTRIATRYLGSTSAVGRNEIYFDQQERRRNTGLYSDLYAWSRASGRVRRLTREARLLDPDLAPQGDVLAAVQSRPGQRDLVLVRLKPDTTEEVRLKPDATEEVRLKPDTTAEVRLKPDTTEEVRLKPDTTEEVRLKADATVDRHTASGFLSAEASAEAVSRTPRSSVVSGFSRTPMIETLIAEPNTQFNTPRWSPDGRSIAVERHRVGGMPEIVLVDVATKSVRTIASVPGARVVTPAWRHDGLAIVAAVSPQDTPFNLFEFAIDGAAPPRQLTHVTGGATWPDLSPDGKTIVFVGYTADGFDLFTIPYEPVESSDIEPASRRAILSGPPIDRGPDRLRQGDGGPPKLHAKAESRAPQPVDLPLRTYSPWRTIAPTSWTPIVEGDSSQTRVGAATGGIDVLAYHAYAASATWLVSGPAAAPRPAAATPDWNLYYTYNRWRPVLWVTGSSETSFFSGPATDAGTPASATLRERAFEAGVALPIEHVRTSHTALFSIRASVDEYTVANGRLSRDLRAVRGAWAFTSARNYGYSVSREDGMTVGATAESIPRALGSFAGAMAVTGDARAYLRGLARHHVVALRAAGGVATGDADVRRTFHLGGASANSSTIDFSRNAASLLRGFRADTFAGSHVAVFNADYRFPIARPQRGAGTWPALLHTVHGAVFVDAGHAWTRTFRADAIKTSTGAELSADVVAGYFFRMTLTAGIARGHDGSGIAGDRTTMYFRVGRAF